MLYHIRYAWRLYRGSCGTMSLLMAWRYPLPARGHRDGDPIDDAEAELECWLDG